MFDALKKTSIKNCLIIAVICLLAGGALIVWQGKGAFYAVTGYKNFESLAPEQIKGQLVEAHISENFGYYLEEYEKDKNTGRTTTKFLYYIIWTGDENATDYRYMTIKVPVSYRSRMNDMAEAYQNGTSVEPITFYGEIKKLDEEENDYFENTLTGLGWTQQEIADGTLPYYINVFASKSSMDGIAIVLSLVGAALIVFGLVRGIKAFTGGYLKKIKEDINSAGCTEASAESDYNSAPSYTKKGDLRVGRLFTYHVVGPCPRAIANSKILWAYQNTVTHRTNGVKTGTTYNVMVYVDGQKNPVTLDVPNETTAQDILQRYMTILPWVVVGYTDDLKRMFNKDRAAFLNLRYNTVEHVAVEPGMEGYSNAPQ
ncbi:MAG: hypothetical protein HFG25_14495 [Lachnospiraceae bacterium]|nr:hypothetical protein [Lachnospiraceae bacterium]